ncbi:MAG TPA: tetratricopeptide repeat protein [bacterium]|nr:tetratricopeptide repeat protein [bacterium]
MSPTPPTPGVAALVARRLWDWDNAADVRGVRGAVLFVDIAGFTRLTESAQARAGTRGIEELTIRLNALFSDLVDAAHQTGGDILKFGGDALLAAFDDTPSAPDGLARALRSAHAMRLLAIRHRRHLRTLKLRLGLAHGPWREGVAGGADGRREHFVWGKTVTRAMAAADASAGQICYWGRARDLEGIDRAAARRIGPSLFELRQRGNAAMDAPPPPPRPPRDPTNLLRFVGEPLHTLETLAEFDPTRSTEHRRVVSLFVYWQSPALRADPATSARQLEFILSCAQETVVAHDGLWARSDPAGPRQKLLFLFGATVSRADDIDRALHCAAALHARVREARPTWPGLRVGIGIAAGTALTGFVGNTSRREFTALGERVNLAARLAARAASGTTLVDAMVRDGASAYWFRHSGIVRLKNVRRPTPVFVPVPPGTVRSASDTDNIVEHPEAMRRLVDAWIRDERAIRLAVAPGADWGRFLRQFTSGSHTDERAVTIRIDLSESESAHPLGGCRLLLRRLLGAQASLPEKWPSEVRAALWESGDPNGRQLSWTDPETAAHAIGRHLQTLRLPAALVIVQGYETAGVLDRLVIRHLAATCRPRWILIDCGGGHADAETDTVIHLGPLPAEEFAEFIGNLMSPDRPARELMSFLLSRSQGVPRLARQFFVSLQRTQAVTRSPGRGGVWRLRDPAAARIPDGLRAYYLQGFDRLPSPAKMAARAIALWGPAAPVDGIAMLCADLSPAEVRDAVAHLQSQMMIECLDGGDGQRVAFLDRGCREAVYSSMSHELREQWHRRIAAALRAMSNPDPGAIGDHLYAARRPQSAQWLARASKRAARHWMLEKASTWTRRAILATQGRYDDASTIRLPRRPLTAREVGLFDDWVGLLALRGQYDEARKLHQGLASLAARAGEYGRAAHHRLEAARMDWYAGHYDRSGREARAVLHDAHRPPDALLTAQAAYLYGETCRRTGRSTAALRALEQARDLLGDAHNPGLLADAHNALGLLHWSCGRLSEARRCFEQSLRALGRRGAPARRGQVANNLGILLEEMGALHKARRHYARAFAIFDRIGIRRHRAYSLGNLANLHRHSASYEQAREAYEEVETELRAIGEGHAAAYTAGNLGDLARDFGDWAEAHRRYEQALQFALKSGDQELKAECQVRRAHLHWLAGVTRPLPRLLRSATAAARRANSREFALYAALLDAERVTMTGDASRAQRTWDRVLDEARAVGLVYYVLWAWYGRLRCHFTAASCRATASELRQALRLARQSGYRWWELRLAILGARSARANRLRAACRERAIALIGKIAAGIGDPQVRARFVQSPLVAELASDEVGRFIAPDAFSRNQPRM